MARSRRQITEDRALFLSVRRTALSLAATAEYIARTPAPARLVVLWILRIAENCCRRMLAGACAEYGAALPAWAASNLLRLDVFSRAEALRLATTFRAVAAAAEALSAYEGGDWLAQARTPLAQDPEQFGDLTQNGPVSWLRRALGAARTLVASEISHLTAQARGLAARLSPSRPCPLHIDPPPI